jgi:hypothetical protein
MEGEREGPLEGAIRARERPLLAVGGKAVHRIRPDLRLDAALVQRRERFVSAVEPDDVRLPSVRVSAFCGGELDEVAEAFRVPLRNSTPGCQQLPEAADLGKADRAQHVR